MLVRINDEWAIKSDRYSFMLCIDRGIRKFPGGVQSQYFEPSKHCGSLSGTIECKVSHDHYHSTRLFDEFDSPNDGYADACDREKKLFEWLDGVNVDVKKCDLHGHIIESVRGHYTVTLPIKGENDASNKKGVTVYPRTFSNAVMTAHSFYLRENDRFGVASDTQYGSWEEVIKTIDETEKLTKEIINGSV